MIATSFAGLVVASCALAGAADRIVRSRGVQVVIPAGWQRIAAASDGPVTDPHTLLVVGTPGARATRRVAQALAVARSFNLAR